MGGYICDPEGRFKYEDHSTWLTQAKYVRPYVESKAKRGGVIVQVVEPWLSKHKALSTNPTITKRKQK
jgi:hypothetical protein